MNEGQIIEYIESQKVFCGIVLETKKNRIRVLNENNRELNLSEKRISLVSSDKISIKLPRDTIASKLKEYGEKAKTLSETIDIEEIWEILNDENAWIDIDTVAELLFGDSFSSTEKSALMRAMFKDKLYFKFNHNEFFPYSEEQVRQLILKKEEEQRKKALIEEGGDWLKENISAQEPHLPENNPKLIELISSYYLKETNFQEAETAKAIFKSAGVEPGLKIFKLLVRLGIWQKDENTDIYKYDIETKFSNAVTDAYSKLMESPPKIDMEKRKDLRKLKTFTIDGESTRDYDDAISIEIHENKKTAYVHITDVAMFIEKESPLDRNGRLRSSSIYMPDVKVPMLHPSISEDIASLKSGEERAAVSIIMELDNDFKVTDYEIAPSIINVDHQITYEMADEFIKNGDSNELETLFHAAEKFRMDRFAANATHISIPDCDVYLNEEKEIIVKIADRETPSWTLVSEFMIKANFLMADFLKQNNVPAIFRSQGKPAKRYYEGSKGTLLEQLKQRKEMSRVIVSTSPEPHCGLGLNYYTTVTSPIRKYHDLVCQRQIKSVFGMEEAYSEEEINGIISQLDISLGNISRIQTARKRYWLLKYLEEKRGEKEPALVIGEKRNTYTIILTNYMLEANLPKSPGMKMKDGEKITVTLQNINARSDVFSVHLS